MFAPDLDGGDLERLADLVAVRVVELLSTTDTGPAADTDQLVWTPAQVAEHVGRSVDWVREHRDELGVLPASGPRPRLHFSPVAVRAWASAHGERAPAPAPPASTPRAAARRRLRAAPDLLPIRGAAQRAA